MKLIMKRLPVLVSVIFLVLIAAFLISLTHNTKQSATEYHANSDSELATVSHAPEDLAPSAFPDKDNVESVALST